MKRALFARITGRILLFSVLQVGLLTFANIVFFDYQRRHFPGPEAGEVAAYLARDLAGSSDRSAFERRAETLVREMRARVSIASEDGTEPYLVATPGLGRCGLAIAARGATGCASTRVAATWIAGDQRVEVTVPAQWSRSMLSIILVDALMLVTCAWWFGRALARPLRHMSSVAEAFGDGHLGARVQLRRADEIGDVATAFDAMADRLSDLLRVERELLANISHELRTPLSRIRFALELATDGDPSVAQASRQDIAEDLDELEQLIGDILASARLSLEDAPRSQGLSPLRLERVSLRQIVMRSAARFEAAYPGRPLQVDEVPAEIEVEADVVQLRRAIDNLLSNAHKYTSEAREPVRISFSDEGERLRLYVIDRGIGVSEGDQSRVFEPFFRVDRSRSRATGGLGLGLLLVKRIIEAHGGTVRFASVEGAGTVVTVELTRA